MSSLPLEVIEMVGQTMAKVVPVTIVLAVVFTVLSHFWACNPGRPWWHKRELITDICYWFFVPVFARVFRIGLMVLGAGVVFNIHDADGLIAFYDNGHGPLSELPLWVQALLFLVASDFMLYWLHRMFHGGGFWKYHAIHHSSEDLEWISAARFHPGQPVHRNDHGRRHPADGGDLAQHHAVGRAVHDIPLRLRSRQPELDVRAVQIRAGDAGLPSLASHLARRGRQHQFRRHLPDLGHSVRHVPDAGRQAAGGLWRDDQRSRTRSADNWSIRFASSKIAGSRS